MEYTKSWRDYRKAQRRHDIKEWVKDIAGGFVLLLTITTFTLTVLILSK